MGARGLGQMGQMRAEGWRGTYLVSDPPCRVPHPICLVAHPLSGTTSLIGSISTLMSHQSGILHFMILLFVVYPKLCSHILKIKIVSMSNVGKTFSF